MTLLERIGFSYRLEGIIDSLDKPTRYYWRLYFRRWPLRVRYYSDGVSGPRVRIL